MLASLPAEAELPAASAADEAFSLRRYPESLALLDSLLTTSPGDAGLLWRRARVLVCLGDVQRGAGRSELYRQAAASAAQAVRQDPALAPARTWHAAALGNIAMYEGAERQVQLSRLIKSELDTAILLDPADDIAWSILGTYYRVLGEVGWVERQLAAIFLGGLPDGGYEDAERALTRAAALAPQAIRHRYELGELYLAWDREEEAVRAFRAVPELPVQVRFDSLLIRRAQAHLERLGAAEDR
jgi:tetratricopeptide (TPR) repeat protein